VSETFSEGLPRTQGEGVEMAVACVTHTDYQDPSPSPMSNGSPSLPTYEKCVLRMSGDDQDDSSCEREREAADDSRQDASLFIRTER
jgi:hypothetical protein